ncbi:MAG: sulfite exporter TauE/SafE family protein [Ignavibacteriae bacterium]|nr:sulfite exporter TauE/SafE family protein [Ignavibacteriota bacterium]
MTELNIPLEIYPFFLLVAFLYSSVGHGGASGYLAIFALFGVTSPAIAPIALALNIVVASTSCFNYYRGGYFSLELLLPFIVSSVPAAFLGGFVSIPQMVFSVLLGIALLLAAVRIAFLTRTVGEVSHPARRTLWFWGLTIGATLGLVSGMVGIGGGVFLSPLLLLLRWADVKRTAATSAAFIVLNSVSGLSGHIARSNFDAGSALPLAVVVIVGGYAGSRLGAHNFPARALQGLLAIVLVLACVKLIGKMLLM